MKRVVQIGVGGFGRNWLKAVTASESAELVSLVDLSDENLAAARDETGIAADKCFSALPGAIAATSPEIAVCVTPPQFHREVCIEALQAGLDVITEKPLADDVDAAQQIVDAAAAAERSLMVSQNYRHNQWARTAQKAVADGLIGDIGTVAIKFFKGPHPGGFREEMEYPLVKDMAIHHFDLIRFITGLDPVTVTAVSWNPKWSWYKHDAAVSAIFEMTGGAVITYDGSWVSEHSQTDWDGQWRIEGSGGALLYEGGDVVLHKDGAQRALDPVSTPFGGQEQSLHEFIQCLEAATEPTTSGSDNLKSLKMVFKTIEAAESGRRAEF